MKEIILKKNSFIQYPNLSFLKSQFFLFKITKSFF